MPWNRGRLNVHERTLIETVAVRFELAAAIEELRRLNHNLTVQSGELNKLNHMEAKIMATLAELQDAVARLETDAENVTAAIAAARVALADLAQQLADLKAAGGILPADLDPILTGFNDVDAKLDVAAPGSAPDVPVEPTA